MNNRSPLRPRTRGPVELVLELGFGLLFVALFAWFIGLLIEIIGSYTLWRDPQVMHAQVLVEQDLQHIAAAPRSLLVQDTQAFAQWIVAQVRWPYERLGILRAHERQVQAQAQVQAEGAKPAGWSRGLRRAGGNLLHTFTTWAVMSMYVAQDVLLRMSVAVFALPAFVLACLVGVVDGLVRRDLRRWGGGRESSFVYHHAKRYTTWALTGGFGLYLAWPFGGFNPAYMVLIFTVLVAITLSTTVAAFKKYI